MEHSSGSEWSLLFDRQLLYHNIPPWIFRIYILRIWCYVFALWSFDEETPLNCSEPVFGTFNVRPVVITVRQFRNYRLDFVPMSCRRLSKYRVRVQITFGCRIPTPLNLLTFDVQVVNLFFQVSQRSVVWVTTRGPSDHTVVFENLFYWRFCSVCSICVGSLFSSFGRVTGKESLYGRIPRVFSETSFVLESVIVLRVVWSSGVRFHLYSWQSSEIPMRFVWFDPKHIFTKLCWFFFYLENFRACIPSRWELGASPGMSIFYPVLCVLRTFYVVVGSRFRHVVPFRLYPDRSFRILF